MTPKAIAALTTLVINIAAGVLIFFMMSVAMNGFSEGDATWGLGAYIILAVIISVTMSLAAFLLTSRLLKKQFSAVGSTLISIPVFTIAGIILKIVSSVIGIAVAEYVRVNH